MIDLFSDRKAVYEAAGFGASLVVLAGAASSLAGAVWPVGIVVALAVVIAGLVVALVRQRRRIADADQRLLDELLRLLSRQAIRRIDSHDFTHAWPSTIVDPLSAFIERYGDPEHCFSDPAIEAPRRALYDAALQFRKREAHEAFDTDKDRDERYVGLAGWEAEGDPKELERFESKVDAIFGAARGFLTAHDALVVAAKKRGYNLTALSGEATSEPTKTAT